MKILLLKQRGYHVYYLGANQSIKSLEQFINDINPDIIISFDVNSVNYKSFAEVFNKFEDRIDKFFLIGVDK